MSDAQSTPHKPEFQVGDVVVGTDSCTFAHLRGQPMVVVADEGNVVRCRPFDQSLLAHHPNPRPDGTYSVYHTSITKLQPPEDAPPC